MAKSRSADEVVTDVLGTAGLGQLELEDVCTWLYGTLEQAEALVQPSVRDLFDAQPA